MSTPTALWKKRGGRLVDGKFRLKQWLGGSDSSAVFLTERAGKESQKAAIKLIFGGSLDEAAQLSRWAAGARLSRPHLIRLFEYGRCQIDEMRLLYVVMEYAEENLAEILPLRPLSPSEASAMLRPTAEALGSLHQAGLVHGRIQPSNIMAVEDQLKISADGLSKIGEPRDENSRPPSVYDAPELAVTGLSPASDIWALGITLVVVLTQHEPKLKSGERGAVVVPETIPQPLRGIAERCLQVDPQRRCTVAEILGQLEPEAVQSAAPAPEKQFEARAAQGRRRWIGLAVAVLLAALVGIALIEHRPATPAAQTAETKVVTPTPVPAPAPATAPPAEIPAAQKPAPFAAKPPSESKQPTHKTAEPGSVLHQVSPEVSRSAQNTITGRVKVSVQVEVGASGNVSGAKLVSAGPSKYFATRALEAARRWKFNPRQVDGQAAPSQWTLRFQFGRTGTQVSSAETKP